MYFVEYIIPQSTFLFVLLSASNRKHTLYITRIKKKKQSNYSLSFFVLLW